MVRNHEAYYNNRLKLENDLQIHCLINKNIPKL